MHEVAPIFALRGVTKRFGDVVANARVDLELRRGEVHCLLGENGAGKSTLIAMLAGLQQPDEGAIEIDGRPCELGSPAVSLSQGIGVVYQHSALIPTMTVLENLMLGERGGLLLDRSGAEDRLAELGEALGGRIDSGELVGALGLGQQQRLEIAKAMWRRPSVLVLDEPTSMLTPQGVEELQASLAGLAAEGVAVLLVTHKLDEALALADRVTVLRAGRVTLRADRIERNEPGRGRSAALILDAMFGDGGTDDAMDDATDSAAAPSAIEGRRTAPADGLPEVLRIEHLGTASSSGLGGDGGTPIEDVSLRIGAGEIFGIAGIDGHGQRHLAEAITGQRAATSGRVMLCGSDITREPVKQRQRLGVRYVTDDRLQEGIVGSFSVALNLVLKRVGERPLWRFGRMDRPAVEREAERLIDAYEIRTPSPDSPAGALSGGNIQKILLARELAHGPRVVVFHKPGYGLDLRTVRRVRDDIRRFVEDGGAALLISTDLDELLELADSIAVLSHGRIVGCVENDGNRVRERIGELMVGAGERS